MTLAVFFFTFFAKFYITPHTPMKLWSKVIVLLKEDRYVNRIRGCLITLLPTLISRWVVLRLNEATSSMFQLFQKVGTWLPISVVQPIVVQRGFPVLWPQIYNETSALSDHKLQIFVAHAEMTSWNIENMPNNLDIGLENFFSRSINGL